MREIRLFNLLHLLALVTSASTRSVPNSNPSTISNYALDSLKARFEAKEEAAVVKKDSSISSFCKTDGSQKNFPCWWWTGPDYVPKLNHLAQYYDANALNTALQNAKSVHSAGSSFRAPGVFALPGLVFNALGYVPRALVESIMAVPSNFVFGSNLTFAHHGPRICEFLNITQKLPCAWYGNMYEDENRLYQAQTMCGSNGGYQGCAAGSTVRPPRLFALPGLLFNLRKSVPGALAEKISVEKRQEYEVCAWLRQDQEFPCSWRATPVDTWKDFKTLKDLNAAQLGQVKEFRPSRRSSEVNSEWHSLRKRAMTSFPESAAIVDTLGMAPAAMARASPRFAKGKVMREEHIQNSERDFLPHCKWLDKSQSMPCHWNDPDIGDHTQIWIEAGQLFTAQQNYGDEHPGYQGAASGLRVPRLISFPVFILHTLVAAQRTMAAVIPNLANRAENFLKVANREAQMSQALLQSQDKKMWCGLPPIWTYPCSWNAEDPHLPGVFMPYVFCKWIVLVPTNMIISLLKPFGLLNSKADTLAKRAIENPAVPLEKQDVNSSHPAVSTLSHYISKIQDYENRTRQANGLSPTLTIKDKEEPTKTKRGWCLIPFLMFYPCWTSSPTATAVRYNCVTPGGWKYWQTFPCDTNAFVDYSEAEPTGGVPPTTNSASNVGPPIIFRAPKILTTFVARVAKTACVEVKSAASPILISQIFTLPLGVFNVVGRILDVLAAAIPVPEGSTLHYLKSKGLMLTQDVDKTLEEITEREAPALCIWDGISGKTVCHPYQSRLKSKDISPTLGAGATITELVERDELHVWDGLSGATVCHLYQNAAQSLSVPRIFSLPILLVKAAGSIPGTIASVLPTRTNNSRAADVAKRLPPGEHSNTLNCVGACENPSKSGASSLGSPRIFRLPALLSAVVSSLPGSLAAVIPKPRAFTASLAAPSFDLVQKSVSHLLGMIWISGHDCGSKEVSGDVRNIDSDEAKEEKPAVEAGREEDELRRRQIRDLSSRDDCTNYVSFHGYCVKADAGRLEVRWAFMGVLGLAGVFCFFM